MKLKLKIRPPLDNQMLLTQWTGLRKCLPQYQDRTLSPFPGMEENRDSKNRGCPCFPGHAAVLSLHPPNPWAQAIQMDAKPVAGGPQRTPTCLPERSASHVQEILLKDTLCLPGKYSLPTFHDPQNLESVGCWVVLNYWKAHSQCVNTCRSTVQGIQKRTGGTGIHVNLDSTEIELVPPNLPPSE